MPGWRLPVPKVAQARAEQLGSNQCLPICMTANLLFNWL